MFAEGPKATIKSPGSVTLFSRLNVDVVRVSEYLETRCGRRAQITLSEVMFGDKKLAQAVRYLQGG